MERPRVIDADTHVDETEATWEYMSPEEQAYKPVTTFSPGPNEAIPDLRDWVVDGRATRRAIRSDHHSGTVVEARELLDVQTRLRHMDELGAEVQVIYPTFFLMVPDSRPEGQVAQAAELQPLARRPLPPNPTGACDGCASRRSSIWRRRWRSCGSPRTTAPAASSRRATMRWATGRMIPTTSRSTKRPRGSTCPSASTRGRGPEGGRGFCAPRGRRSMASSR